MDPLVKGGGRSGSFKEDRNCTFCQKQGHLEDKCWKKHGRPDWANKVEEVPTATQPTKALMADSSSSSAPSTVTLSHSDFQHLLKMAHGDASLPFAALATSGSSNFESSPQGKWLVDSGTTDHITCHPTLFSTYSPFPAPLLISLADKS